MTVWRAGGGLGRGSCAFSLGINGGPPSRPSPCPRRFVRFEAALRAGGRGTGRSAQGGELAEISETQVLEALRAVQDPDLHRDIVTLGFVRDLRIAGGSIAFTIELTTPACPVKDLLKQQA